MPASAPLHHWKWPATPWYRVRIDFAEINNTHFLLLTDEHSKWLEVTHMPSTTNATATIHNLWSIFSTHGLPVHLVSDNGPPFTSAEFETFMKQNGVYHIRTPPFHPSSNGPAEKAVQKIQEGSPEGQINSTIKAQTSKFPPQLSNHSSFSNRPSSMHLVNASIYPDKVRSRPLKSYRRDLPSSAISMFFP